MVAIRAYREGLASGDMALARRSLAVLEQAGVAPPDAAVLAFADALAAGDRDRAGRALESLGEGPLDFLQPVLAAWLAVDAGDAATALGLQDEEGDALDRRYASENHALILLATGRTAEGLAAVRAQLGALDPDPQFRMAAASLLAGRGKRDAAQTLLAGEDPVVSLYRARLGRGAKGNARFGASRFLVRVARDLASGETAPLAITLARSALILDRGYDRARIELADALLSEGAGPKARMALAGVSPDSPFAREARGAEIAVLAQDGQEDAAIQAATALSASKGASGEDARLLGDLLAEQARFAEAATAYHTAIEREGEPADWTLLLKQGAALEQAGRWSDAVAVLQQAVQIAPAEPLALNYLGYAQVERGENLPAATAMLEQAHRLAPEDPNIADSLGWAYYRQGSPARALPLLEQAARAENVSGTVQEHVGDVLWRLGRRYEARYAWSAAQLDADEAMAVRLTDKLARGLSAVEGRGA
ncbi:tetratricopeptide repeat protein [Sphingomonas sp. PL-96]|uniref:tetratricopeptide repeat protein n=1 Tax=Sphingomonas sp. PL-96 TaxID=2887201 RepID=UPI001E5F181D|nr:tetratricopeptide repeat protein [Sphingomonas sp. PL-96]MCC2975992.1 tetratricopeptide repeat protein [Sphingomonas sp. PL-96]